MVDGQGGPGEVIEADAELLEAIGDVLVIAIYDILRAKRFFLRPDGDGHAVFVRPAYVNDVLTKMALVAGVDVGGKITAGQMTKVDGAVSVRQRAGHEGSFKTGHTVLPCCEVLGAGAIPVG